MSIPLPGSRERLSAWAASLLPSVLRTAVPWIVGWCIARGPVEALLDERQLTTLATFAVTMTYYAVIRLAETYVWPWFGVLLGWVRVPVYVPADPAGSAIPRT